MAATPTPMHYYDLGTGQFDETAHFPFTGATPTELYLGSGGALSTAAPTAAPSPIPPLPILPVPQLPSLPVSLPGVGSLASLTATLGDAAKTTPDVVSSILPGDSDLLVWSPVGGICGRPIDQWSLGVVSIASAEANVLAPCVTDDSPASLEPTERTYTTAPLTQAETIAGPMTADIYMTANTTDTELVAEVQDVTPNGTAFPLTEGALLGSQRAVTGSKSWTVDGHTLLAYHPYTQAAAEPVVPGKLTEYQVEIFPTLATIAAGDRIRLTLSTADTPHLVPIPADLAKMAGGIYAIGHNTTAPSELTVDLIH